MFARSALPVILMFASNGVLFQPTGPPAPRIAVKHIDNSSSAFVLPSVAATVAAKYYGGRGGTGGVLVESEDQDPFGPPATSVAWMFQKVVDLRNDASVASVEVTILVDASSGSLLSAFTRARDKWLHSLEPEQDPEEVVRNGWNTQDSLPAQMTSNVVQVLEAVWREGFDPGEAGQIVVRPRWVTARFPAREINGEFVSVRPEEKEWIVQILGTATGTLPGPGRTRVTSTGMIFRLADGSLEFLAGFLLP
jgi:hypothetical protein